MLRRGDRRFERRAAERSQLENHRRIDDRKLNLPRRDFVNRRWAVAGKKRQRPFIRALLAQSYARLQIRKIFSADELRGHFEHQPRPRRVRMRQHARRFEYGFVLAHWH